MTAIIALLAAVHCPVQAAQLAPQPQLTDREQIQADRAKAAAEDKKASTSRPWDRDENGKRPWEKAAPAATPVKP